MKKISFKILSVLCVIVIIASTSLFLLSAATVDSSSLNGLIPENITVSVVSLDEGYDMVSTVTQTGTATLKLECKLKNSIPAGSLSRVVVDFGVDSSLLSTNYFVLGSYDVAVMRSGNFSIDEINFSERSGSNYQDASVVSSLVVDNYPTVRSSFNTQSLNTYYDNYTVSFYLANNNAFSVISFYIRYVNLKVVDPSVDAVIQNQNENTDKILNAGDDVPQPDFDNTNDSIDNTVGKINSIEGQYKIDADATQSALSEGNNFILGTDMQKASIQVKNWIERFGSENIVISGFLVAAMVLGLCFWVIGRKSF